MDNSTNFLWSERYRPQTISDCILPERLKSFFQLQIDKGHMQNMLLIGGAGTGKTTAARAMCDEMGIDVLFINASENGNIDTLRTLVRSFASTISFIDGKTKCVILDEADYLTNVAQPALRAFIEEFSSNCRFILTANYGNRIIDPIKSRCAVIDFVLSKEEKHDCVMGFNKRVKQILDSNNITYDNKDLAEVIIKYFPDYRKILNELQRHSHDGKLSVTSLANVSEAAVKQVLDLVKAKKFNDIRKWVVQNIDIDFSHLVKHIYDKSIGMVDPEYLPALVIILSEYDYKRSFVMDVEIHTVAMLCQIMLEIKFK
jgi:DNA polymerase III delta prime subunit